MSMPQTPGEGVAMSTNLLPREQRGRHQSPTLPARRRERYLSAQKTVTCGKAACQSSQRDPERERESPRVGRHPRDTTRRGAFRWRETLSSIVLNGGDLESQKWQDF